MLRTLRKRQFLTYLRWLMLIVGVLLLLDLVTYVIAEGLWFQAVDYVDVFFTRLEIQSILAILPFLVSLGILQWNLTNAQHHAWIKSISETDRPALPGHLRFAVLLPLALFISVAISLLLLYHGQVAFNHWHPNQTLYTASLPLPLQFRPQAIWQLIQTWGTQRWQPVLVAGLSIALLIYPQVLLKAIALLVSIGFGVVLSEHWSEILLALHATPFNEVDPLFGRDIGFYIFTLPFWELIEFWVVGLAWLAFLSASLIYLLSANSLSRGYFPGFAPAQQRHLYGLGGFVMVTVALGYWLGRYSLMYTPAAAQVAYGASYTDVKVILPTFTALSILGVLTALFLIWRTITWRKPSVGQKPSVHRHRDGKPEDGNLEYGYHTSDQEQRYQERRRQRLNATWRSRHASQASSSQASSPSWKNSEAEGKNRSGSMSLPSSFPPFFSSNGSWLLWRLSSYRVLVYGLGIYALIAVVMGVLVPMTVQRLVVQPNELQLEQPYIRRTIALTRNAFDLDKIQVESFDPQTALTYEDLQENDRTVNNIRLWDTNPLLETNRQLQRIRLYYEFPDADIDRYSLPNDAGETVQQQVLIAARELDYSSVPPAAQTWINQHLIYTHGYGFTVSPVNVAGEGGLPDYYIQGLEPILVDPRVQGRIPVGKPRIYYGELTDTYVMTQTQVRELDYPSGSDNIYNTYDGWGGVDLGSLERRLLYAKHMRDWRMLFTDDFTPQTRILFRRNINSRIRAIAPFLRFDSNPYLVSVDTGGKTWERGYRPKRETTLDGATAPQAPDESYLYWVIDAYTTSKRYPYSDPLSNDFNYIRNSVKVVVDAYHGAVNFYVADEQDPVIKTWQAVFPGMFQPLSQMPAGLRTHIRYPTDFYRVQSTQLMVYHMTDPVVFYNREDQWRAPNEIYGSEEQLVEPYYLIMRLPIGSTEEFILLRPYTPLQRNNLIAWLAARSDGDAYGKMLLYIFPKDRLIFGPEQIEARINQDPVISERISLWNRQGSRTAQGNLLVIPIEQSLLYVEPLYLVAEQNQLPTLARVIVAYGNRIVMAETLDAALAGIFQPAVEGEPIIRSVDEAPVPDVEPGTTAPPVEPTPLPESTPPLEAAPTLESE